ncbi:hypothetical protein FACS1894103_1320 [Campylobacterota bacterium]|nr:hypothetical protein FACS1894103_1320 [Campylobacterota bacterium]
MAEEPKEAAAPAKPKISPILLIIVGAVAIMLIVVVLVVVLLLGSSGSSEQPERTSGSAAPGVSATLGTVVTLDQFIVNLLSNDGRRYLKVKISLELTNANTAPEVDNKAPLIRDTIIQQLSSKRFDEISTESGKVRLREELKNSINRYLLDGQIKNVFFNDFVIQ